MTLLKTLAIAFSMFSAIPMPQFIWTKENMKYTMCAFPFVGVIIGISIYFWSIICNRLGFGSILFSSGITLIPIAITGGIHLDGFCDTVDAISSHATREKKLEILKDPHTGAFAIIGLCFYLILYFALATELNLNEKAMVSLGVGYVLSRTLSGLAIASFPLAKNSGLAYTFADMSAKNRVRLVMSIFIILLLIALLLSGGIYGVGVIAASILSFVGYYFISKKEFGGITGDLAGWFLQICEILIIASLVIIEKVMINL